LKDQEAAVIQQVLRWESDLVSLQEVGSADPLDDLLSRYSFVGASRSHCGYVQLYVACHLAFCDVKKDPGGVVICKLRVKGSTEEDLEELTLAAVHLPVGLTKAKLRSRMLMDISQDSEDTGVLILGDTNCKDEEAFDVCKKSSLREACYAGYSWGARNNKFDAECEYEGVGLRYDRMLMSGSVWAETFLVGQWRQFFEGHEFFLSDHHPVLGFFDCHNVFHGSSRAEVAMAGARRARVVALRDLRLREEQLASSERLKQGREERACVRQNAAEDQRVKAWQLQQQLLLERGQKARERWQIALGAESVWKGEVVENFSRHIARVSLDGWQEEGWDVEVPTAVFLRGIVSGQSDVVMPCLLQVLLRLPVMQAWISMHADHCTSSRGCAICWLRVVHEMMGSSKGRRNVTVDWLPEGVDRRDVQDVRMVLEKMFAAWSKTEVDAGRMGEMPVPASSSVVVSHVDRLFGWLRQTRARCERCSLSSERCTLPASWVVTLPVKSSIEGTCSVTDLYIEHCLPEIEFQPCHECRCSTKHAVASRLASTPEMLVFSLERSSESRLIPVDVEEELQLPGLTWMRLVAVIYRARRNDGSICYSCSCRGPMDAWWYFEDGKAPEPIKRSVSHVKQKHACMLFYERIVKRGKAVKRKASGASGILGEDGKRRRTSVLPCGVSSPPVSGPSGMWPVGRRGLKRYPSWVDALQLESMRQARLERACEYIAREHYRENSCEGGWYALVEACLDPFEDEFKTPEDMLFAHACLLKVLGRLRLSTDDVGLAALCKDTYPKVLEEIISLTKNCEDCLHALEMASRVSGAVCIESTPSAVGPAPVVQPTDAIPLQGSSRGIEEQLIVDLTLEEPESGLLLDDGEPMAETPASIPLVQGSEATEVVMGKADEQGMEAATAKSADEVVAGALRAPDNSALPSAHPQPCGRRKRGPSGDAEAKPVRRSARIALRSGQSDTGASSARRHA
jgi:hypothetical protein